MVIVYDKTTKAIVRTEDNTMVLILPVGTLDEQKTILAQDNQDFVSIPYEMGGYVYDFDLCFDTNGLFTGLQPKQTT